MRRTFSRLNTLNKNGINPVTIGKGIGLLNKRKVIIKTPKFIK